MKKDISKKINQSAENVKVPESLMPEQVEKMLRERSQLQEGKDKQKSDSVNELSNETGRARSHYFIKGMTRVAAVATVALLLTSGGYYISHNMSVNDKEPVKVASNDKADQSSQKNEDTQTEAAQIEAEEFDGHRDMQGDIYKLASNYDEVYMSFEKFRNVYNGFYGEDDIVIYDDLENSISASEEAAPNSSDKATSNLGDVDYSSTNVIEKGIDEGDIVKTDGKYIYKVVDNSVYILGLEGKIKLLSSIDVINVGTSYERNIQEMFVAGDNLVVILQKKDETIIRTYDVSDRTNPERIGTVRFDGRYDTSRKNGDYIYVFSERDVQYDDKEKEKIIPEIAGEKVGCDCIYIREGAWQQQICVAVNINAPSKVTDNIVVSKSYGQIYMGKEAMYVYETEYDDTVTKTRLAKFSYKNGKFNAVAETQVNGEIRDAFAISEKDNNIRVLTTSYYYENDTNEQKRDYDRDNTLVILDENMKEISKIEGIAKNEDVYAARYIGDLVYFITYRNTDPLFIADLSDVKNPKLLGEAQVSGFSDYLQSYTDGYMLGIGYETDEDSNRECVKLCMFDVRDKENPKVDSVYLDKEMFYLNADNYKGVLVDEKKNIIGMEMGGEDGNLYYNLYTWKDGTFTRILSQQLDECENYYYDSDLRSLYVGDTLYVIYNKQITAFDMKNDYEKKDYLKWGEVKHEMRWID